MEFTAKDIISMTAHAEFPDTLVTAELARAEARLDGRSVPDALRKFAALRSGKIKNRILRDTLNDMARSKFPETNLYRIRNTIDIMVTKIDRTLGGVVICDSVAELKTILDSTFK